MNKVIMIGNLTKDAELRYTQGNGNAVAKFTIAIGRGYKDKNETDFINCVAFGKIAENIAQYTQKGTKVAIEGALRTGSYDAKDGTKRYTTEVFCNNVEFLNRAQNGAVGSNSSQSYSNNNAGNTNTQIGANEDPFADALGLDNDDIGVFLEPIDEGDSPF